LNSTAGSDATVNAAFEQAFRHARELQFSGRHADAEHAFRALEAPGPAREAVLRALVELYTQTDRAREAIDALVALTNEVPDRLYYYARLAAVLEGLGEFDTAIGHYQRLLQRQPRLADAHYNLALLYRKARRYAEALSAYEAAIDCGVRDPQQVYSNMGIVYGALHRTDRARAMYERALEIEPRYGPALFNLAGLLEEAGERAGASAMYERIPASDPLHWEALARLAHARRMTAADEPFIARLREAIGGARSDRAAQETLYFALGKALDDLERYDEAFAAYRTANDFGRLRHAPHDRPGVEQAFDRLIESFTPAWLARVETASTARPIFVCGMPRSGSTLVERMLGAHPEVTAGGELDILPWLAEQELRPYPAGAAAATRADLERAGERYLAELRALFPNADRVTDKRPGNFLHLGLVRAMFPRARIVYTRRAPLDNCLSVYFQPLGANLSYTTDLVDIAYYYRQHVRLMAHWQRFIGPAIFTVDYDELVRAPEPILRRLLAFLGLGWDDRCLDASLAAGPVGTASLWQVREPLHERASGRWRHYARHLAAIRALFE
jgi:tetratricopeptide (TPR) repeat protein